MTNKIDPGTAQAYQTIKIWDLPVRIFHWSLVLLFIAAYVTNSLGSDYFIYHLWSGYALLVLVSFRILWGFVGSYHARFKHFVKNPITTAKYAISVLTKTDRHYLGHNPLGAVMVVILLLAILTQAITGLFTNDEIFNLGPLYAYISDELSLQLTSLHRQLFYWIVGAVTLHILAVVAHVVLRRDNILKAMFSGKKKLLSADEKHLKAEEKISIKSSKICLAIFIVIVLATLLSAVILTAPEAVTNMDY